MAITDNCFIIMRNNLAAERKWGVKNDLCVTRQKVEM